LYVVLSLQQGGNTDTPQRDIQECHSYKGEDGACKGVGNQES